MKDRKKAKQKEKKKRRKTSKKREKDKTLNLTNQTNKTKQKTHKFPSSSIQTSFNSIQYLYKTLAANMRRHLHQDVKQLPVESNSFSHTLNLLS